MPRSTRATLRARADQALRGLLGRGLSRSDRRLVAHAYANAADRCQRGLPPLRTSKYSRWQGQPVILNPAMIQWIAGQIDPKEAL